MSTGNATPTADSGQSRASVILGVVPTVLVIAATTVILRIYTRAVVVKHFGFDDVLAVVAFITVLACGLCVAWDTRYGLGHHIETLDPNTLQLYNRTFYYSVVLYNAALLAIKMAFLAQYYRVFADRGLRRAITAAIVVIFCWCTAQLLIEIMVCLPIRGFWDKSVDAFCIPNYPQWYFNAAGNIITDFAIFVLPLPAIGQLDLAHAQKITLFAIFGLGFFTCIISIVRVKYLRLSSDYTWDNVDLASWSLGEICLGLTCACLPTLRPLLGRAWPARRGHQGSSQHSKNDWSTRTDSTSSAPERGRPGPNDEEASRGRHMTELSSPESFHYGRQDSDLQSPESFHYGLNGQSPPTDDSTGAFPIMRPAPARTMAMQRVKSMVRVGRRRGSNRNREGIRVRFDIHQSETHPRTNVTPTEDRAM